MRIRLGCAAVAVVLSVGCASLEGLRAFIQPPQFDEAEGRQSEIRLTGPAKRPLPGALP